MNVTLGKEFERRISEKVSDGLYTSASEVIRDGVRMLFEKGVAQNNQLEILREEVAKGFEQLAADEISKHSVMDIFELDSLSIDGKPQARMTMPTYRLSPLAAEDFFKIVLNTLESWGNV